MADKYGPRRLNAVNVGLLLCLLAAGYWFWRFFPAYFDGWTVDHILKETAAAVYRANRLREPERTASLKELIDKARADIIKKANVTDPELRVDLEIEEQMARVMAEYSVVVTHAGVSRTTTLHFKKKAEQNIKAVTWE